MRQDEQQMMSSYPRLTFAKEDLRGMRRSVREKKDLPLMIDEDCYELLLPSLSFSPSKFSRLLLDFLSKLHVDLSSMRSNEMR